MNRANITSLFERRFGAGDCRVFFAPGRVNLIGEYTDFNGGHVLPCALPNGTYLAIRPRNDGVLRMFSENFPDVGESSVELDALAPRVGTDWCRYPLGAVWALMERGARPSGADMLFVGDIPNGAGLSSSASIEVVTAFAFSSLCGLDLSLTDIALIGKKAENEYVGVNCGIMDQFSIAMGRRGEAVFLDCDTLEYEYVPAAFADADFVIMNTNKRRGLGESKYNERRRECEAALHDINSAEPVASLGSIDMAAFERLASAVSDPVARRRARHAVSENQRTLAAVAALRAGDAAGFGRLMTESHISLRDDFEVTGRELDCIVTGALGQAGVYGARMTGAGFGGCAVALVETERIPEFCAAVGEEYAAAMGVKADIWRASAGGGVAELMY